MKKKIMKIEITEMDLLLSLDPETVQKYKSIIYKTCEFCGKEFVRYRSDAIHCSPACSNKDWMENKKSERKKYMNEYKRGAVEKQVVKCAYCGKETTRPKYCSIDCRLKSNAAKSALVGVNRNKKPLISARQLMPLMLTKNVADIDRWVSEGMKCHMVDGKRMFDLEECQAWHRGE